MSNTEILSKIQAFEKDYALTSALIDALTNYSCINDVDFLNKKIESGELKSIDDIADWLYASRRKLTKETVTLTRKLK